MALAVRIRPWVIALYKFLWHRTRSTLGGDVFASLFQRIIVLLNILRSKWQTCYDKQRRSKPSSKPGTSDEVDLGHQASENTTNIDQVIVPLDNISCSMYPYGTGLHDSARSSRILNSSRSSHNLGIVSRSRNPSSSSHNTGSNNTGSNNAQSPLGGGYTFTIQPTTPRRTYSISLPELGFSRAADIHEAILQHRPYISQNIPRPRSDSPIGSVQLLSPDEISSSRVNILPASRSPIEQSIELPVLGMVRTSSQSHSDDLEIQALDHPQIYPVAPENFQRYKKRRRM